MVKQDSQSFLAGYLAVGDDSLKREAVVKRLRARLQKLGDISFNFDEFDGEVAQGADIVTACITVPFASPYRMIHVKNVERLRKADLEPLVEYFKSPSETTVVLLEARALSVQTRLYKAVAALGKQAIINCAAPKRKELPRLVRSMAVGHGITLTEGAAYLLVELVGEDTVRLDTELGKIALGHRGADPVTEHEVSSMVSRTTEVSDWDFLDAMSARNAQRAFHDLALMPSVSPTALLGKSVARVRELICAKSLMKRGQPRAIAAALGKKQEWMVKHHAEWASRYTDEELRAALLSARDAEQAMKSGTDPRSAYVEWLVAFLGR